MAGRSKKAKESPYTVSIDLGDSVLKGSGISAFEALSSIKRPVKIVGKTFVTLTKGTQKSEQMLMPVQAKRLFFPNAQQYLAKQLEYLLR